jgi:signal transduction histidine kinase
MTAGTERTGRWVVAGPVLQFAVIGLIVAAFVGGVTAIASRRIGEREAIVDARTTALVRAQGVVEPAVTPALMTGDADAVQAVANVVEQRVIDNQLVRVKIWRRDGTILYSNEPRLIGARYALADEDLAAIDKGVISADISNLSSPENQLERSFGKLLQVYLPLRVPNGERLLFEAYFRYDAVAAAGSRIWRGFAPITLGSLAVLELVQIPIAWSLARRLRQRQREREALLVRALEASDVERRRIASDLHDGVVQDLAGVAFSLTGAARAPSTDAGTAALLEKSATAVRSGVSSLRSLLVEIYPPNLDEEGLGPALAELLARAERAGLRTELHLDGVDVVPGSAARLLYRAAQEGLRNVVTHADASGVELRASTSDGRATIEVRDDGVGLDAEHVGRRAEEGHVGLRTLQGLVRDAGGELEVVPNDGRGTVLRVEVPLT